MKAFVPVCFVALVSFSVLAFAGTTGKIAGTVVDAKTGEPLPSVNVVVSGTSYGASTNVDGYFAILNVPPGRYRVVATLVGFRPTSVVDVRVDIDQTTTQNFRMSEEAVTSEEVTVVATRPVVQKDVAASRANIEAVTVQKLPVQSVSAVVGLEAGIQGGLVIRAGSADQTAFIVDGLTMRDERTNNPYTGLSLSAIQDIQVQTGGFNAEYGNIRSGVVNVITREGNTSGYSFNFIGRMSPSRPKHFGPSIYDPNSYWIRPYVDPAVSWTGTGKDYEPGAWDKWTRDQYPNFEGWNSVSQKLLQDNDPNNDLTPDAAQRLWLWEHRRQAELQGSDWDVDMGFGGPVPYGEHLGNLRFFTTYRQARTFYIVPLSNKSFQDKNFTFKLTSNLSGNMKLNVFTLIGRQTGTNSNNAGDPGIFTSSFGIATVLDRVSYIDGRMFATDYWAPSAVNTYSVGAKFSHTINASTFYEATAQWFQQNTDTNPARYRNTAKVYRFGNNYYVDEAPFGFQPAPSTGITGLRMGVGFSNSRDTSRVGTFNVKFDMTSQIDKYNQIKTGLELAYTDNNVNSASIDVFLPSGRSRQSWHTFPIRGALYVQDKLEFEGMIANLGLRMDYLNVNGEWYTFDAYNRALSADKSLGLDTLVQKGKVKPILNLMPRVGVAFPISENSKLFFNYGHTRQIPNPRNLFMIRRYSDNNQVFQIADPSAPLPKTIQYELGYEQSLFDEYLIRVSGYYKDITNESFLVGYTSRDSKVDYDQFTSNRYRDQRGFEVTLKRDRGKWIQGFLNYTYQVNTTGYFGLAQYYESASDQRAYERSNVYQEKPIPQPYARANIDLYTPPEFGPEVLGIRPLGDWRVNLVGTWQNGEYFTWTGGADIPGISLNAQWNDFWNFDMRISKNFQFGRLNFQLFADISNLLNFRYMERTAAGFPDGTDYNRYMSSLHLPTEVAGSLGYINIPGSDRPGDYRKEGSDYQPIVTVTKFSELSTPVNQQTRPFYYVAERSKYYQLVSGTWQEVESGKLNKVLDDKAYIDMPNQETLWFLNPRRVFYGIRLSFDM